MYAGIIVGYVSKRKRYSILSIIQAKVKRIHIIVKHTTRSSHQSVQWSVYIRFKTTHSVNKILVWSYIEVGLEIGVHLY